MSLKTVNITYRKLNILVVWHRSLGYQTYEVCRGFTQPRNLSCKKSYFAKKFFQIPYTNNNVHQIIEGSAHFGIKNIFLDGILTEIGYLPIIHLTHRTFQHQSGWISFQFESITTSCTMGIFVQKCVSYSELKNKNIADCNMGGYGTRKKGTK